MCNCDYVRDMLKLLPKSDVPQQWRQEREATPAVRYN